MALVFKIKMKLQCYTLMSLLVLFVLGDVAQIIAQKTDHHSSNLEEAPQKHSLVKRSGVVRKAAKVIRKYKDILTA